MTRWNYCYYDHHTGEDFLPDKKNRSGTWIKMVVDHSLAETLKNYGNNHWELLSVTGVSTSDRIEDENGMARYFIFRRPEQEATKWKYWVYDHQIGFIYKPERCNREVKDSLDGTQVELGKKGWKQLFTSETTVDGNAGERRYHIFSKREPPLATEAEDLRYDHHEFSVVKPTSWGKRRLTEHCLSTTLNALGAPDEKLGTGGLELISATESSTRLEDGIAKDFVFIRWDEESIRWGYYKYDHHEKRLYKPKDIYAQPNFIKIDDLNEGPDIIDNLNKYGDDEWELISISGELTTGQIGFPRYFILKKRFEEEQEEQQQGQ